MHIRVIKTWGCVIYTWVICINRIFLWHHLNIFKRSPGKIAFAAEFRSTLLVVARIAKQNLCDQQDLPKTYFNSKLSLFVKISGQTPMDHQNEDTKFDKVRELVIKSWQVTITCWVYFTKILLQKLSKSIPVSSDFYIQISITNPNYFQWFDST